MAKGTCTCNEDYEPWDKEIILLYPRKTHLAIGPEKQKRKAEGSIREMWLNKKEERVSAWDVLNPLLLALEMEEEAIVQRRQATSRTLVRPSADSQQRNGDFYNHRELNSAINLCD